MNNEVTKCSDDTELFTVIIMKTAQTCRGFQGTNQPPMGQGANEHYSQYNVMYSGKKKSSL